MKTHKVYKNKVVLSHCTNCKFDGENFLSKYLSQSVVAEAVDSGSLIMGCLIICSLHQSGVSIECNDNIPTNQKPLLPAGEDPSQRQAAVREGVHQGGVGVRQQGLEIPTKYQMCYL